MRCHIETNPWKNDDPHEIDEWVNYWSNWY